KLSYPTSPFGFIFCPDIIHHSTVWIDDAGKAFVHHAPGLKGITIQVKINLWWFLARLVLVLQLHSTVVLEVFFVHIDVHLIVDLLLPIPFALCLRRRHYRNECE